ncbi:hypothetical protein BVRB_5g125630 isoform B [Beta vulgaris subsp. vulgaris]|uniref:Uncharacterized protein n=2 Tax=Beta vulgaris subsp. vulgaris TaxID=3555 RepID=A0A0J8B8K1_BETVV|nr:hypothetical protein BVRB_5g125630 isoform B [Beta vulgaris subsp. vulgaris]
MTRKNYSFSTFSNNNCKRIRAAFQQLAICNLASSMEDSSATTSFNYNKHLKEQFVSNLNGSSMLEIFSLALVIPVIVLLRRAIGLNFVSVSHISQRLSKKDDIDSAKSKYSSAYMVTMAVDFLFIVIPVLLLHTVLSEWIFKLALLSTFFILFCLLSKRYITFSSSGSFDTVEKSISSLRVVMMIITCLCILAVDFNIFPRKYAKTESYGTSWMDLGVGSFVVANALVSRQARNVHSGGWKTALQSTCPLILLGVARLASTTGVDYQVHVGEYGVHWNFFFTLAAVSLLTSAINIHPKYCGILGLFILIGYQIVLVQGLNTYLLSDVRGMDIVSQNKEGIFSIFGYLGMYLVGVQMGYELFFKNNYSASSHRNQQTRRGVCAFAVILWLLTLILNQHVEQASRRMCNMAYVMLVLAVNFEVLAIFMLSEFTPGSNFTALEGAFNQNLLASFLLANLLTGLVNLSVDTLFATSNEALAILVLYAFALCFFTGLANFYGFRLKFW